MIRELREREVEFVLECQPEDIPVEGNASAIDPETDAETESWIYDQLERGNEWAWCAVVVRARWDGFEGTDCLGCCSYESEESFCQPGGYFDDMKKTALAHLNNILAQTARRTETGRTLTAVGAVGVGDALFVSDNPKSK
jgi:hypothetical protein